MAGLTSVSEILQSEFSKSASSIEVPAMPEHIVVAGHPPGGAGRGGEDAGASESSPPDSPHLGVIPDDPRQPKMTPLQRRLTLTGAARSAVIAAIEEEMGDDSDVPLFQTLFFALVNMQQSLNESAALAKDPDEVISTVARALSSCHQLLVEAGYLARVVLASDVDAVQSAVRTFVHVVKGVLSAGKALANSEPSARAELMRHLRRLRDASTEVVQATPRCTISGDADGELSSMIRILVRVVTCMFDYVPTIASLSSAEIRKKRAATKFVAQMLRKMAIEYYNPGEMIVKKGERGKSMYFITSGEVEILLPSSTKRKKDKDGAAPANPRLGVGSFFGEIALFLSKKRTASVVATTQVDVAVLTKDACDSILENFPDLYQEFKKLGEARLQGTLKRGSRKADPVPEWFSDMSRRVASLTAKPVLKIYTPHRALIIDTLLKSSDSEFLAKLLQAPEETAGILGSVCTREEMESLVDPLLRVYDANKGLVTLIQFVIQFEVERTPVDMAASLMRGSSFGPKVLTALLTMVGDDYTHSVCAKGFAALAAAPQLTQLTDGLALETLDDAALADLTDGLVAVLNAFVDAIFAPESIALCPPIVRVACHITMVAAEARFGQFEAIVGGILFLRLICPSILNQSERFGYDPSNPPARKLLILVSKALQNLSNGTPFPPIHRYSARLNEWLKARELDRVTFTSGIVELDHSSLTRATCIQSFKSQRSSELPLELGCIVDDIRPTSSPAWLHGARGKHSGFVPANHVVVSTFTVYQCADAHHLPNSDAVVAGQDDDLATIRALATTKEVEIYAFVEKEL